MEDLYGAWWLGTCVHAAADAAVAANTTVRAVAQVKATKVAAKEQKSS